jgi:3D-(3,5/4)-trihydroxycyclohexane-1,2-dione acylhydrolase (decyclizing)
VSGGTVRLTVGQAVVRFLAAQYTERDGARHRLIEGCFGIFGHGNVAGVGGGAARGRAGDAGTPAYRQARNEQAMVHASAAFARMRNRLSTLACTTSIGPGRDEHGHGRRARRPSTGCRSCLLPGDTFATRVADPVLQQLEFPLGSDVTVNDTFRPVSRFFDRVSRPGAGCPQRSSARCGSWTDQAETGAATIACRRTSRPRRSTGPSELFEERVWQVPRPGRRTLAAIARAVETARVRPAGR